MIINHNVSALNTYRQLSVNNSLMAKSLEKLSSGLRINRAGDDAAGLAISEKMRGQIRGLNMAVKNAQDAISLIQTAEGALNETHSILQRMRELAVQATNETNTADDRLEIQKEIEQLKSEIDRISSTTEFNTMKLLNGSLGASATSSDTSVVDVVSATGLKAGTYNVKITTAATRATLDGGVQYTDDSAVNSAFGGADKDITINGYQIDTTGVTTKDGLLNAINSRSAETGVTASWDSNDNTLILTTTAYGSGQTIAVGGANAALIYNSSVATFTDGVDAVAEITYGNETTEVTASGQSAVYKGAQLLLKGATDSTATITVNQVGLRLQIGANEDQEMSVDINEISTATLGSATEKIANVTVSTTDGAKAAITTIDAALKQVSAERSKLGAFQNRLEHTINNLGTAAENLTAAESRIRDVDYAEAA